MMYPYQFRSLTNHHQKPDGGPVAEEACTGSQSGTGRAMLLEVMVAEVVCAASLAGLANFP